MITVNEYCKLKFGEKLYKLSLDAGMTCPNRDGALDTRGCIFCSAGGSGDFAADCSKNIDDQIKEAKERISKKYKGNRFIAYFQAYTNTYAPVEKLRELYIPVANRDDIAVISIATRPDCISDEIIELLDELNKIKPVWIELGLQTIHEESAVYIRRGYDRKIYDEAIEKLNRVGIHTITHLIFGLPGETKEQMMESVKYVVDKKTAGIKIQLLHVLKGTDLAVDYSEGKFDTLTFEEYTDYVIDAIKLLPEDMVLHRMTGDGPRNLLIAPLWSTDKKRVLNELNKRMKEL